MALSNKGCFIIDGQEFAAKQDGIKQTNESLATEDSGRTDDGIMHIYWVRDNIRKWEIEMPPLNSEEASRVLSLVQGKIYDITIYDVKAGEEVTVKVYTSNTSSNCYSGVLYNGLYQGIRFSAIEL